MPPAYDGKPGTWRSRLDRVFEARLSPEEQAEAEAEQAEADRLRLEREWDSWGTSPEQQAAQRRFMEMAGPEG